MLTRIFALAAIALLTCNACAQVGTSRTWTSADGRPLTGKLISVSPEEIVVQLRSGKNTPIPVSLLSEDDKKLVTTLVEQQALEDIDAKRLTGFKEGKYADAVKDEWVKYGIEEHGLIYQLYIGREATRKKAGPLVPLFIQLHGRGAIADDVQVGKVEVAAQKLVAPAQYEKTPCVVCAPLCPTGSKSWKDHVSKLEAIIADLADHLPIDRDRIYISGYSMGAQGVGSLLTSRPDFYAGALFADGSGFPKPNSSESVRTPMWFYISGDRDSSKIAGYQADFAKHDVELKYNLLPDVDHNSIHWKMATNPETYEWLFSKRHGQKASESPEG